MKAGKALEQLVGVIQEHLKDNPDVQITQNAKLVNRSGNEREIDVFVQTKVNGENIGIAFECKDYNRNISEPIVDAFWAKINDLPQVHKGIIVTTTGYTKGAQTEAETHKVGLYLINNIPLEQIIPSHNFYSARAIFDPIWNSLQAHFIATEENVSFSPDAKIRYFDNDEEVNLQLEIFKALYKMQLMCELAAKYMEAGKQPLLLAGKITPTTKLYIEDIKGEKYEINYFRIPIRVDFELEECQLSSPKRYTPLKDGTIVSVSEYSSNFNDNAWVVVESGNEKNSFYIKENDSYYKPNIEISGQRK